MLPLKAVSTTFYNDTLFNINKVYYHNKREFFINLITV